MRNRTNRLNRIHAVLQAALKVNNASNGWSGWAQVLGIDANQPSFPLDVADALIHLNRELDFAVIDVRENTKLAANRYEPHFASLKNALQLPRLSNNWVPDVIKYVTPESLNVLAMCSDLLPSTEDDLSEEHDRDGNKYKSSIDEIRAELNELEVIITGATDLPPDIRRFLEQQLERMRRGVREYQISGAVALWRASSEVASETAFRWRDISPFKDSHAVSGLTRVVRTAAAAATIAISTAAFLEAGDKIGTVLGETIEGWEQILREPPRQLPPGDVAGGEKR